MMRTLKQLAMAAVLAVGLTTLVGYTAGIRGEAAPQPASSLRDDDAVARARFRARVEQLKAIQKRREVDILAMEAVIGIGIGRTKSVDRPEFVVLILEGSSPKGIPSRIGGVPVRVEERPPVQLLDTFPGCALTTCHGGLLPLPVEMGNAGGAQGVAACSLGFRACDLGSLELVFVSNAHCYTRANCNLVGIGVSVRHPNGTFGNPIIGDVAGHVNPSCNSSAVNLVDATKVNSTTAQTRLSMRDIGTWAAAPGDPLPGDLVQKSGRTTGRSIGIVSVVNVTVNVTAGNSYCCGALTMSEQIEWESTPGLQGGDSGSALLTSDIPPRVAGLNWGQSGTFAYANHIENVLSALNLSLSLGPCFFPDCAFTIASATSPESEALNNLGHRFRRQVLERSGAGQELTRLFYQISHEAVEIAQRNTILAARTGALLLRFESRLRDLVELRRADITARDLVDVDDFLQDYAAQGSSAMQEDLRRVRELIRDPAVQRTIGIRIIEP